MGQVISDVTDILNYKENKNTAEKNKNKILSDIASDEAEKENIVKKVLATQRAKYGASGVSSNGISEQNVLGRLKDETEAPYESKKEANINKLKNISVKKKNMLVSILEHLDKLV